MNTWALDLERLLDALDDLRPIEDFCEIVVRVAASLEG